MSTEPIVQVKSRRLVCENQKFNVYFDHVVDPAGFEVPTYLVVAPKQKNADLVTGVAVLPVQDDMVGLVRIYRPAIGAYSWEIPHGFAEPGESDQVSAIRELMEETGLIVKSVESLGLITPDAGVLAGRVHLYLANGGVKGLGREGEIGLREFRWFSRNEFETMVVNSEIQDSFTLSAWCKFLLSQRTGAK